MSNPKSEREILDHCDRLERAAVAVGNARVFIQAELDREAARALVSAARHLLGGFGSVVRLAVSMHPWWPANAWARLRSALAIRREIFQGRDPEVMYLQLVIRTEEPLTHWGLRWVDWPCRLTSEPTADGVEWVPRVMPLQGDVHAFSSWLIPGGDLPAIDRLVRRQLVREGRWNHSPLVTIAALFEYDDEGQRALPSCDYRCPLHRHPWWFRAWLAVSRLPVIMPVYRLEGVAS